MLSKPTYDELEARIKDLDSLILNTPGMFYSGRPDWTTEIITHSDEVSGYSIDEFNSGQINWMDIIHPEDKDWVVNKSPHFTNVKKTISIEYRIIAKDGSTRWVLDKKTARFSSDNIFLGVSGIVLNITERKQIEIKLRESEIKYKGVFDESIAAIYVFDTEKNFIDSNQAGLDLLGYSRNELLSMSIPDVDADPVVVLPAHNQLLDGDRIINYEHRLIRKDGRIITVLNNSRPLIDRKNNVIGMLSTLIDITERIQAQDALQKAHNDLEKRIQDRTAELESTNKKLKLEIDERKQAEAYLNLFKKVVASATDAIGISSPEGRHWYQNTAFNAMFGDIGEDPPSTLYCDEKVGREVFKTIMVGGEWIGEVQMQAIDGKKLDILLRAYPFKDQNGLVLGLVGIHTDITAKKRSHERFKLVAQSTNDVFYEWDVKTDSLEWFSDIATELGYTEGEIPKTIDGWIELIHPEDRQLLANAVEVHRTATHEINYTYRVKHRDGTWRYWYDNATPVFDKFGLPQRWIGGITDITDRKKVEEELLNSEEKYRLIMEVMIDGIYICSPDFKIEYMNPAMIKRIGRDATGEKCYPAIHSIEQRCEWCTFDEVSEGISTDKTFVSPLDNRNYNVTNIPIQHKNGTISKLTINRDITEYLKVVAEKDKAKEQLFQAQKMESMGLLAGGVAHDLNNILSGIVSYPELLLMDLPEDSKLIAPLKTIMDSGIRAAAIVQDLLTVARGVAITKAPSKLNDLVAECINSPEVKKLKQIYPEVVFKTHYDEDLFNIYASDVHIRKAIMNLIINAADAVNGRGNISISALNRYLETPLKGYEKVSIGEYAVLSIADNGPGISSKDLGRIFEPFYTKKKMGRSGTGLGLSVVWNVIRDHQGFIDVKTGDSGTTFDLYFPITRDAILKKDSSLSIKSYKGNGEMVLVVDDEKSQREISCKMMDKLGYKYKAVLSGEEAIEYLHQNSVDLVLLDMIMDPGISGYETYKRIIKNHPGQKAVVLSGFSESDDVKKALSLGAGRYVKKPVTIEKMGLAIKEVLKK